MKKIIIASLCFTILLASCKKASVDEVALAPKSGFMVVNAALNISSAKVYAHSNLINWKNLPGTDAMAQFRSGYLGTYAGSNHVRAVSAADTTIILYSSNKAENFAANSFNTLFLAGNTGAYEGVFIQNDNIVNHTDSAMGIRFINLSPNSTPLSITLSTAPTTNIEAGLVYKQKSDFKKYPALASTGSIIFQVRDAGGVLLASYTLPVTAVSPYGLASIPFARFRNITLVVKGLQGTTSGTNAFGVFPVAHY